MKNIKRRNLFIVNDKNVIMKLMDDETIANKRNDF